MTGQVSHDDSGNILGVGDMAIQMREAYASIEKVLDQSRSNGSPFLSS